MARTSIVVVTHNHASFIADCVHALERANLSRDIARLILVDNASEDGTADRIAELLTPDGEQTRAGLPALFIRNTENLGFSGGNNQAIRRALEDGDAYVFLLNPDTEVRPGFLQAAVDAAERDEHIAQVQSLLLRHDDPSRINSCGNALHYLGFGYVGGDGELISEAESRSMLSSGREIAYASGAVTLLKLPVLRELGLLNEELFAYHEDLELSWRLRLHGYRIVLAPDSRVVHKYQFHRSPQKNYLMERNRIWLLLVCYRWATLALLVPAFLAAEAAIWLFAWRQGWARDKWRSYTYFFDPKHWGGLIAARRRIQRGRCIDDSTASRLFSTDMVLPGGGRSAFLDAVANPMMRGYWWLVRRIMWW